MSVGRTSSDLFHTTWMSQVTFHNMDVSNLLSKLEHLHSEFSALKCAIKLQVDTGEDLCNVTMTTDLPTWNALLSQRRNGPVASSDARGTCGTAPTKGAVVDTRWWQRSHAPLLAGTSPMLHQPLWS